MKKEIIATKKAPAAVGPYSQAIRAGDFVYTAGQIGLVPGTKSLAGSDVATQAEQALNNLQAVLEAAGSGLEYVVKTTVFLRRISDYAAFNDVYARYFSSGKPARSAVAVAALPLAALVEVEAVALVAPARRGHAEAGSFTTPLPEPQPAAAESSDATAPPKRKKKKKKKKKKQ